MLIICGTPIVNTGCPLTEIMPPLDATILFPFALAGTDGSHSGSDMHRFITANNPFSRRDKNILHHSEPCCFDLFRVRTALDKRVLFSNPKIMILIRTYSETRQTRRLRITVFCISIFIYNGNFLCLLKTDSAPGRIMFNVRSRS